MPSFVPFRGVRYNAEGGHVDDVICPPYDVISSAQRAELAARSAHNAVHLEVPRSYQDAAARWHEWLNDAVLVPDDEPAFYAYRLGYRDENGRPRQTTGILGALELAEPGAGILPHEQTTPKDRADRFDLLRATGVNLSPIWVLTPARGFGGLAPEDRPPDSRATDDAGVHHRLWRVTTAAAVASISEAVAAAPVIVADGHHRFEVATAYRAEGGSGGGRDHVLAFVVELDEQELSVLAIHRVVSGLPVGFDLVEAFAPFFDATPTAPADGTIAARMADAGGLGLVTTRGTWLLRPRRTLVDAAEHDLDSSRLDVALASIDPKPDVRYQHGWDNCAAAVAAGEAEAAVLLRPATVAQIAAIGRGGVRMPPKTTFFWPKPATGLVFRELARG